MKKNTSKILEPGQSKLKSLLQFASFAFTAPGLKLIIRKTKRALIKKQPVDYTKWIAAKTQPERLQKIFAQNQPLLVQKPKISVVIVLSAPNLQHLKETINSVTQQLYSNWELVVVNNGNLAVAITSLLEESVKHNTQITVITNETDTLLAAKYNAGIAKATGDFVLFVEEDALLTNNCLAEFALYVNQHPTTEIVYSDDDTITQNGIFANPNFKPGWSPDTLLSRNYIGTQYFIKKELLERVGAVRDGYNGSELFDLLLRATEQTNIAGRIPQILFHGRIKPLNETTSIKAISEALVRRGMPATIKPVDGCPDCYDLQYEIKAFEKVSVIIPTKDRASLLKIAVDSIMQKTTYPDFEIIVLNNNSVENEFFELMNHYQQLYPGQFKCIGADIPFNFAKLMNMGVAASTSKFVVFCNNDIEVIHPDWMTQMVQYAQHKNTGAVGVKLLYPNDTIQHPGIVLGINGDAGHAFINKPADSKGYQNNLATATNYAAVTGACLMCRKELYLEAGGMDEALEIEYNDLDLCLKFLKMGHYNICLPVAAMYHHESVSRGHPFRNRKSWRQHEKEFTIFKNRWQHYINDDPFYNPNLTLEATDFSIKSGS